VTGVSRVTPRTALLILFGILLTSRLAHIGILWPEETLPLAAAVQMLQGKTLYGEVWFDKPPLVPSIYLLWGAELGWALRIAGALYCFAACVLLYRFATDLWSRREGLLAAWLLGFFLIFGIPSAVLPLAADLLMLVPHIAAVYLAWRGKALWSGVAAGVAFLFNSKAAVVGAVCIVFAPRSLPQLAAGFLIPNAIVFVWLSISGALPSYVQQVWEWGGMLYSRNTFVDRPVWNGFVRTLNWLGFHAALVVGTAAYLMHARDSEKRKLAVWLVLSFAAVAAGWRFFPRYYFHVLPVFALLAARGFFLLPAWRVWILAALLLVPTLRFGPRYIALAADLARGVPHEWDDIVMDQDSREAAALLRHLARPGSTLFVWGYRPEIFAYTRMPAATRFLESQPLTGVYADRHLTQTGVIAPELARQHRTELTRARPDFVLDGLAAYNPPLAITAFPDLAAWLAQYEEIARTNATVLYRRR
jgi:hypothetical protein